MKFMNNQGINHIKLNNGKIFLKAICFLIQNIKMIRYKYSNISTIHFAFL